MTLGDKEEFLENMMRFDVLVLDGGRWALLMLKNCPVCMQTRATQYRLYNCGVLK
tara:strand:- start:581 stop:745 length:165 start_codon:yes stop_codon:yes gene_type:complete